MKFDVLISVYNKEHPDYLKESLKSVFSQDIFIEKVILVEDGPLTPEIDEVVNEFADKYSNLKIIKLTQNQGLGNALNQGLKFCSSDLVFRMDSDDICFPNRFKKQIAFMMDHPEIDASSCWISEFEGDPNNVISIKTLPQTHKELSKYIKSRCPLNHPAVIFRKSSVEKVGGYQHFPLFEDYYLWIRMFAAGCKFANLQESLLYFRTSPETFKRRGGLKYAVNSAHLLWEMHRLGIISVYSAIIKSFLRGCVYLMPNKPRTLIYRTILRKRG